MSTYDVVIAGAGPDLFYRPFRGVLVHHTDEAALADFAELHVPGEHDAVEL
jgi:hypothetical protein